jgi:hypothetical protein
MASMLESKAGSLSGKVIGADSAGNRSSAGFVVNTYLSYLNPEATIPVHGSHTFLVESLSSHFPHPFLKFSLPIYFYVCLFFFLLSFMSSAPLFFFSFCIYSSVLLVDHLMFF